MSIKALSSRLSLILATVPLSVVPALAQPIAASVLPQDLTAWGMFMAADWVVKSVMIGLGLASVATWTVLISKSVELGKAQAAQRNALGQVEDARSLAEATRAVAKDAIVSHALISATAAEVRQSADALHDGDGLKERVASCLDRIEAAAGRRMTRGTGILATIGSTAPFIGLFGTVWGIMNSFIGISASQTTNLAVVAPGIAEALLATATGLVAAIPAVAIYNHFARRTAAYKALIGDTSAAVLRLISRDLSRGVSAEASAKDVSEQNRPGRHARTWYLAEEAYGRARPIWTAYAETIALAGIKAVLTVGGLTGQGSFCLRRFYQPSRAVTFKIVERREMLQGAAISLTLTHSL